MLIDTHAHINFENYGDDRDAMIQRAFAAGVETIICIGMMPEGGRSALALARKYPGRIRCSVGIHPYDACLHTDSVESELESLLGEPEMVLMGEMGIDAVKAEAPIEAQIESFGRQIRLANRLNKPVCIHSREAFGIIRRVFETVGVPERGGFAHCFSDGPAEARQWVEWGFKISFAGQLTFKNAESLRDAARSLRPQDVVVETDCPFLAPMPFRGKRNEPAYVTHTAAKLAEIWGIPVKTVAAVTTQNAKSVLGL